MTDYTDSEGNPTTLIALVRSEPEWAANRIRAGREERAALRAALAGVTRVAQGAAMHRGDVSPQGIAAINEARRLLAPEGAKTHEP